MSSLILLSATRINRAATELNLDTVSLYAYEDRNSAHRWDSDESYLLPASGTPVGAYLNITNIIDIAKENNVDAIHPGYGFLSESAEFAVACAEAGITFVGPSVQNLETFGDKTKARELAIKAGVSVSFINVLSLVHNVIGIAIDSYFIVYDTPTREGNTWNNRASHHSRGRHRLR